ncbi:hypothetical protein PMI12_01725 [Variovorax sp. CF313]|uniref:hypothetical protein n=1 Tax=Variovorax sp. CF313 TaxID=1144315 RepID=UPI000270EB97|nr:hypothetical protein [Variovorax sp. CF313]EJL77462.1 hypothetical protein PMI12_01725 [Variovorax sp. CF313]
MATIAVPVAAGNSLAAVKPKHRAKNRPGESLHSQRRLEAVDQQVKALHYRKMGLTYAEIADRLGMGSPQTAWSAVESALKRTLQEPADDVRKLELGRLDAMFMPVYADACRGDLAALNSALNIMTRRARMLGLDASVRTENRTDLTANSAAGVLIVGGVMTPEAWAAASKEQSNG